MLHRLQRLADGRPLTIAMESTGTFGDALRQALTDAKLTVHRVSGKAVHDYAEIFDGVPSQHDGKDAAMVAELAAMGKSAPWPYEPAVEFDQELRYWVERMDVQQRIAMLWLGRLEALLARHWPEATQYLELNSETLLQVLVAYGGPAALAADAKAAKRLKGWGGFFLNNEKIARVLQVSAALEAGSAHPLAEARSVNDVERFPWPDAEDWDYSGMRAECEKWPDYPIVALQQLARNAVLHRSYENTHAPIRLYWFEDRVEIQNPI